MVIRHIWFSALAAMLVIFTFTAGAAFAGGQWQVSRIDGDVWIGGDGPHKISLQKDTLVAPGAEVRTGPGGRVMLTRGEERVLVTPNTSLALPGTASDGLDTTIVQKFGSTILKVEKRNVRHFSVETPYLAAVVKGTQFTVSVGADGAKVEVTDGIVEVQDLDSGDVALVRPGQFAFAKAGLGLGLDLGGGGKLPEIRKIAPREALVEPLERKLERKLKAPAARREATKVSPRPVAKPVRVVKAVKALKAAKVVKRTAGRITRLGNGKVRINATLGVVKMNYAKATKGLSRATVAADKGKGAVKQVAGTIWNGGALGGGGILGLGGETGGGTGGGSGGGDEGSGGGGVSLALGGGGDGGGVGLNAGVGGGGVSLGAGVGGSGGVGLNAGVGGGGVNLGAGVGGSGGLGLGVSAGGGGGISLGLGAGGGGLGVSVGGGGGGGLGLGLGLGLGGGG